jgi:DNA-binding PadR family transcriptional regulator
MVLALLGEGDMHPYEMIRLMRFRRDDRLVAITSGTMYHTVERLEKAELLVEVGVDREGNRPERTTYAVTDAGRAAVTEWVRRELPRVDHPAEFRIALAEAHNLDRAEVVSLLRTHRDARAAAQAQIATGHQAAIAKGVPTQYLLELEREDALLTADLEWLDHLIQRLEGEEFPWGSHEPSERYLEQRKAARL